MSLQNSSYTDANFEEELKEIFAQASKEPLSFPQRIDLASELSALLLNYAIAHETREERSKRLELGLVMNDPKSKAFLSLVTDRCFRSSSSKKTAESFICTLKETGVPSFLSWEKRWGLHLVKHIGKWIPWLVTPILKWMVRSRMLDVIIVGDEKNIKEHIEKRKKQGFRLNINRLGEAILGETEAGHRISLNINDLKNPLIDYISIKISSIYSQIQLLDRKQTLSSLKEKLRQLFDVVKESPLPNGSFKFINLDMEEYRDLDLTVSLFMEVLSEEKYLPLSMGIVLQAYLPESFEIQQKITDWALNRINDGGAPIKIRLVKGANLAGEAVEASLRGWPLAPFKSKLESDGNFIRMLHYGIDSMHIQGCRIGVASHNLFDIAYALILTKELGLEEHVSFEMLEGMAESLRRAVQKVASSVILYCPVCREKDFNTAVAYLIRRLDEASAPQNFLHHYFHMRVNSSEWNIEKENFVLSIKRSTEPFIGTNRTQNRLTTKKEIDINGPFSNEPDTDFSLEKNQKWLEEIHKKWFQIPLPRIPCVLDGIRVESDILEDGFDPSAPEKTAYTYHKIGTEHVDRLLEGAKTNQLRWSRTSFRERAEIASRIADRLRYYRGDLIGALILDVGKNPQEADVEVSEAIDFAEYYARQALFYEKQHEIGWSSKGILLVASPWNFPCAIAAGGILAGLLSGNSVIFKPAKESVLVGWVLASIFWEAGVPTDALSFIVCDDDPVGSKILKDPRVNTVILTGATSTAKLFMNLRPGLDLHAETGGKDAIIVTAKADRDLAAKDIIQSAFGFNGQKCSACSLLILEKEVYEDPVFQKQLQDATNSLKRGSAWDFSNKITPLIFPPKDALKKAIDTLEEGESWLVPPHIDPQNPRLLHPCIKWGVKEGSFTHKTELFGPHLSVMCAENLEHAVKIVNNTPYGLTSGLHSLDPQEKKYWLSHIRAGNLYINRGITGAIVQRQPFGGCKASQYGSGKKAGGPHYLLQFMHARQIETPAFLADGGRLLQEFMSYIETTLLSEEYLHDVETTFRSARYAFEKFYTAPQDVSLIVGQDNYLSFVPQTRTIIRFGKNDHPVSFWETFAAAYICGGVIEISVDPSKKNCIKKKPLLPRFEWHEEEEERFCARIKKGQNQRIRLLSAPSNTLKEAASAAFAYLITEETLQSGWYECLHYLREVALSEDYHRYGNLGLRENEIRAPLL